MQNTRNSKQSEGLPVINGSQASRENNAQNSQRSNKTITNN